MKLKELEIELDKLRGFFLPKASLEQWRTPGKLAAKLLFLAEPRNKVVADLGAGTGVLGIGAALLGAKKVYLVEIDKESLEIAKENCKTLSLCNKIEFFCGDVEEFNKKVDLVLMNPPFGSVKRHEDLRFVRHALKISKEVYAILSLRSKDFWLRLGGEFIESFRFMLRKQQWFHKKKVVPYEVGIFRFVKDNAKPANFLHRLQALL